MLKKWFCVMLALVVGCASLSFAEEVFIDSEAVIPEPSPEGLIIEALPGDIALSSLADLESALLEPDAAGLLDEGTPAGAGTATEVDRADFSNDVEPKLQISAKKLVIGVKEKCTVLTATRIPENSKDAVTWSSNKSSVAKVDKKTGRITGVAKGTAIITAKTASGLKASCTVSVKKAPDMVTLTPAEMSLTVGQTGALKSKLPSGTGSTLTYTSANRKVATVDRLNGVVTAVAPGTTKITVKTFNGKTATCNVTVTAEPTEVFLPETLTICLKEKMTVAARAVGPDGKTVPTTFKYSAKQGTGRITVNAKTGKVVGRALGTAQIRVSAENGVSTHLEGGLPVETVCEVNVVEAPERVDLSASNITIGIGQTCDLNPRILAADGTELAGVGYTVASSSDNGLSVSESGVVQGLAKGVYTVTVSTFNGVNAVCRVNVLEAPSRVALSPKAVTLEAGTCVALTVTLPTDTMASCRFTSSDSDVATVDEDGYVTAHAPGTAIVRVETHNSRRDECTVTVTGLAEGFSVSPSAVSGSLDEEGVQLSWRFDGQEEPAVTFKSADPSVATVSDQGYIAFVGVGTTRVTATAEDGRSVAVEVTVSDGAMDVVTYRLFAAYSYYDSLPFVKRNAESMANVFKKSSIEGQGYATKVLGNPSKDRLLSGIASLFADADDNDVSVVYLCSHGHNTKSSYSNYRLSLVGYDNNKSNPKYYLTAKEIFASVQAIRGNVVLILDSCYSGTFINDMKSGLQGENGRIAVLTAASNTRATYYNNKAKAVDFFTFFLLQGLGYNEKEDWWNANAGGDAGSYPGYFAADLKGNGDGAASLAEFYNFAANCIDVNIPTYMTKSWYWGEKDNVQKTRIYAGNLKNLVIYRPE